MRGRAGCGAGGLRALECGPRPGASLPGGGGRRRSPPRGDEAVFETEAVPLSLVTLCARPHSISDHLKHLL